MAERNARNHNVDCICLMCKPKTLKIDPISPTAALQARIRELEQERDEQKYLLGLGAKELEKMTTAYSTIDDLQATNDALVVLLDGVTKERNELKVMLRKARKELIEGETQDNILRTINALKLLGEPK